MEFVNAFMRLLWAGHLQPAVELIGITIMTSLALDAKRLKQLLGSLNCGQGRLMSDK
jgi:hypothetical protein